jgi:hypothetical protein
MKAGKEEDLPVVAQARAGADALEGLGQDAVVGGGAVALLQQADARAVLETSKFMAENKVIPKALEWSKIKDAFARTAPLTKQAYDKLGAKPGAAEFTRKNVSDLRGRPVWEIQQWSEQA